MTAPAMPITCIGKQAVWWMAGSERILDDTVMFYRARKPMFVALREADHLWPTGEFRCFAKDGKVIGVSRYFYDQTDPISIHPDDLMTRCKDFYDRHLKDHFQDIVFDLYAPGTAQEKLIEINPYGLSDPCLFGSYSVLEGAGGVRLVANPTPHSVGIANGDEPKTLRAKDSIQ